MHNLESNSGKIEKRLLTNIFGILCREVELGHINTHLSVALFTQYLVQPRVDTLIGLFSLLKISYRIQDHVRCFKTIC
jgi:hypothetical protein